MGNKADVLINGNIYYLCYELIDASTGKRLDQAHSGLSYTVNEKIKWPDGSITDGATYSNDNNYCGWNLHTVGNYTGIITISGNINVEVQVACTVQKKIELQMHRWMSSMEMGDGVSECRQGEYYYSCYELIDKESGTLINSLVTHNYTVLQEIYYPDGTLCTSYNHTNKDNDWLGFRARQYGTYTIRYTLKGMVGSNQYDYSVDKKIEVIQNPISISASKNSVSLVLGQKESETIDIVYGGYYNGSLSYHWERSNSNVSCSWGDSSEKTCPLTLTANTVGNTVVTVSMIDANTKQKLVSTDISVSVVEKNYTITYHANGGTGAPSSQIKAHGLALTLSSVIPSRFGYNFLGWNTSYEATSGLYKPSDSFTENADTTLYAIWKIAPAITVDPESILQDVGNIAISIAGTTEYIRVIPRYSSTYVLYSKGNYDTVGSLYDLNGNQLASNDDGGEAFNFKIEYPLEENTTYYLGVRLHNSSLTSEGILIMVDQKTEEIPYRVTFDSCGGTDIPNQSVPSGGKVAEPNPPVRAEYTFEGWYTDADCTIAYDFSTIVIKDFTLYAKWKLVATSNYMVKFDAQGGTVVESQIVSKGAKAKMPEEPVRAGYIFKGWYCNGELFDFDTEITEDIVLKAVWVKIGQVMAPVANIESGSILRVGTELNLRSEEGATIYYTINGEEPTTTSILYTNSIVISKPITIKAFAVKEGYSNSEIVTLIYTVKDENAEETVLPAPFANLVSGSEVEIGTKVILACLSNEAEIYYTVNGENPTRDSTLYTEPILIDKSVTIKAIAIKDGYKDSDITEFFYIVTSENILPEDRPVSGEVPDGIWVAGIRDKQYTSKPVLQSFRVYDNNRLLKEKTDYTVSYKNNTRAYTLKDIGNPSLEDKKKAPQIVIRTKGNYAGKQTVYFNITSRDISDETEFDTTDLITQYNKKKNTPMPTLTWNGKKLKSGTDFYVKEYEAEKSNKNAFIGTEKGNTTYGLTLAGKGNFTGERKITLTVIGTWTADSLEASEKQQILMNKVKVSKISNQPYMGKAYTWEQLKQNIGGDSAFQVTYQNRVLEAGVDYQILDIINSDQVGTAALRLQGLNTVAGQTEYSFVGIKEIPFKVTGRSIKKARIYGLEKSYAYTGTEICPDVGLEGIDAENYTVEYQNNKSVGRATIVVKGINACTGTKKTTFKITGYPMDGADIKVNEGNEARLTAVYTKGGAKPDLTVSYGSRRLTEGKDYTLKYSNNQKIAGAFAERAPMVTIRGKGDFSGSRTLRYSITMADITQSVTMRANDIPENKKVNKYQTKITLYDTDEKTLKAGTDYDQKSIRYYVMENNAERMLTAQDRPLAGTVITVKVKGKGNYGTGEISTTYRILSSNRDISKGVFKIENQPYTGKPITLTQQSQFKVDKNGNVQAYIRAGRQYVYLTLGKDFEVVENSYVKNVNKGKATVTLHGIGEYGGYKTVSFNISTRSVSAWWKGLFG